MRRRRKDSGGSLDSLLDTMTNVVGILVIVLAVTQLGVGDAVKRIAESLPKISPEMLDEAKTEEEELRKLLEQTKIDAKTDPTDSVALDNLKKLKAELEQELKLVPKSAVKLDDVTKLVNDRTKRLNDLETRVESMQDEIARINAQLDDTPIKSAPPPEVITLPNPRAAPKGIQAALFVCREGKVIPMNVEYHRERARAAVKLAVKFIHPGKTPKEIDCEKLVGYFEKKFFGDRNIRYKMRVINHELFLVMERRENAGEGAEKIHRRTSLFQQALRKLDPKKQYARFYVWGDSFDVYIEARAVTDKLGFLAGWHPQATREEHRVHMGMKVACIGKPKPKPKPKPPVPPVPRPKPPAPLPNDDID